jgi:hypothetical protein
MQTFSARPSLKRVKRDALLTLALRAWLLSCCPSGKKYILPVEDLIKLALMGVNPGNQQNKRLREVPG